jgi:hypothetical protein
MKKSFRKLSLNRDTIRVLLSNDLATAAGGVPPSRVFCPEPDTRVIEGCRFTMWVPCATNWTCADICQDA